MLPAECVGLCPRGLMHKPVTKDEAVVHLQPASIGKQRQGKTTRFWEPSWQWLKHWPTEGHPWALQLPARFSVVKGLQGLHKWQLLLDWAASTFEVRLEDRHRWCRLWEIFSRLGIKSCTMISELLWLVRSSPTSDLTVSAFWKVGENWRGKVCKWCNVTQSRQT